MNEQEKGKAIDVRAPLPLQSISWSFDLEWVAVWGGGWPVYLEPKKNLPE